MNHVKSFLYPILLGFILGIIFLIALLYLVGTMEKIDKIYAIIDPDRVDLQINVK